MSKVLFNNYSLEPQSTKKKTIKFYNANPYNSKSTVKNAQNNSYNVSSTQETVRIDSGKKEIFTPQRVQTSQQQRSHFDNSRYSEKKSRLFSADANQMVQSQIIVPTQQQIQNSQSRKAITQSALFNQPQLQSIQSTQDLQSQIKDSYYTERVNQKSRQVQTARPMSQSVLVEKTDSKSQVQSDNFKKEVLVKEHKIFQKNVKPSLKEKSVQIKNEQSKLEKNQQTESAPNLVQGQTFQRLTKKFDFSQINQPYFLRHVNFEFLKQSPLPSAEIIVQYQSRSNGTFIIPKKTDHQPPKLDRKEANQSKLMNTTLNQNKLFNIEDPVLRSVNSLSYEPIDTKHHNKVPRALPYKYDQVKDMPMESQTSSNTVYLGEQGEKIIRRKAKPSQPYSKLCPWYDGNMKIQNAYDEKTKQLYFKQINPEFMRRYMLTKNK